MTDHAAALGEGSSPAPRSLATPGRAPLVDVLFVLGLLAIPLEFVQVGPAQPGQVWMLLTLPTAFFSHRVRLRRVETITFAVFALYVLSLMYVENVPRIKAGEQAFKFFFLYPGFYYVGRYFGSRYAGGRAPVGYTALAALLAGEYAAQILHVPVIYQDVDFQASVLHGTFKERNWIAMFFFMYSYFIFEFCSDRKASDSATFLVFNTVVTFLSQSKTIIVACGIVVLIRSRLPSTIKLLTLAIGAYAYWQFFSGDLSNDALRDRLEDERGLAYDQSLLLIANNVFGYGVGFVEAYFGRLALVVGGLGEGTNSVFSVPLDLMIIAGVVGVWAWLVFFCGVGLGATTVLAPVAALSLLNPLHQSDIVYFFVGMLLSGNDRRRRDEATPVLDG